MIVWCKTPGNWSEEDKHVGIYQQWKWTLNACAFCLYYLLNSINNLSQEKVNKSIKTIQWEFCLLGRKKLNIRQFEICSTPNVTKSKQLHEAHPPSSASDIPRPETGRFITMYTRAFTYPKPGWIRDDYIGSIPLFRSKYEYFPPILL